jgi:CTP-dependent riboflavin kinase
MAIYRGRVTSGTGDFSHWLRTLEALYHRTLGVRLFPGTLNLDIGVPWHVPLERRLRITPEEMVAGGGGLVGISIIACRIIDLDAFVLRTDANETGNGDHPLNIVEIAATVKIRERYGLADGSVVRIDLP